MENEQYRHAMSIAIVPIADSRVTFDNESIIGEGAEIIKAMEIGQNLRANASGQFPIAGLEHSPLGSFGNCVDDLQTESAHGQLREFTMSLTAPPHRDGTCQASATGWAVCDYV